MKLLIVGGAGYVGSIVVPALEKEFDCVHYDLQPVRGYEHKTILADVGDEAMLRKAVHGMDAVLYLAMGATRFTPDQACKEGANDINPAFDVNVRGWYRLVYLALKAGVKRLVYVSSLSVFRTYFHVTEESPADQWLPYGFSKRVGEFIGEAASRENPSVTISSLRVILPRNERDYAGDLRSQERRHAVVSISPEDTRSLFVKAVQFDRPGFHIIHASGDLSDKHIPNRKAFELLGWKPSPRGAG
jgi:nucleoside-diphosphate-sugar epimerase